MYAVIKSGGKQYKVQAGDVVELESLDAEPGKNVELDLVMLCDGSKVVADAKSLASKKVKASVVEHKKSPKVIVFKMHKRKRYQRTRGHRQHLTCVKIDSIPAL